jgi:hypothetical protein
MPLITYDISVAFGAANFSTVVPSGRVVCVPLMPGSTRNTGRPEASSRYFPGSSPPPPSVCHEKYRPSRGRFAVATRISDFTGTRTVAASLSRSRIGPRRRADVSVPTMIAIC